MPTTNAALRAGLSLAQDARFREAIDLLTDANRDRLDPELEKALVKIRHDAIASVDPRPSDGVWPKAYDDHFAGMDGIPEMGAGDLTAEHLGSALTHHGSLIVRGLVPETRTEALVADIDSVFDGYDEVVCPQGPSESLPWYSPFDADGDFTWSLTERVWAHQLGGIMAADSPRALGRVLDALHDAGVGPTLASYLGEWPALSVKKFTLRRTPHDSPSEWHQDGSFLGENIRTVNLWLALSHCGVDAPGLDIVAKRFDHIVETGTDDSLFDWSVSRAMADRVAGGQVIAPVFAPGDAILFDQMTLHRTKVTPEMTRKRYAVESWFFAPSTYPNAQIPLAF